MQLYEVVYFCAFLYGFVPITLIDIVKVVGIERVC